MATLFRNENIYGSGVRDLYEIVAYEIGELGNTDISAYLKENYGYKGRARNADAVINFLKEKFPEYQYGLWLCSKQAAIDWYDGTEEELTEYEIPSDAVIISDLGYEGVLYASKAPWIPVGKEYDDGEQY